MKASAKTVDQINVGVLLVGGAFIALGLSPWFDDNYTVTKWVILYLTTLVASIFVLVQRNVCLPKLPRLEICILAGILAINMASDFYFHGSIFTLNLLRFLTLVSLTVCAGQIFACQKIFPILYSVPVAVVLCLIYDILQMFNISLVAGITDTTSGGATFGNANMFAQYLAISILIDIFLTKHCQSRLLKSLLIFVIILALAKIITLNNRSILLALTFAGVILLYKQLVLRYLQTGVGILAAVLLSFGINYLKHGLSTHHHSAATGQEQVVSPSKNPIDQLSTTNEQTKKSATAKARFMLWGETFKLIRGHFWGIGSNNFQFSIIPYLMQSDLKPHESLLWFSPHNEFLEVIAEKGVVYFILCAVIISLMVFKFLKSNQNQTVRCFTVGAVMFFLVEQFFQFPMSNAFPFYASAFFLAFILSNTYQTVTIPRKMFAPTFGLGFACLWVLIITTCLTYYWIGTSSNHKHNPRKMSWACQFHPEIWNTCYLKAMTEFNAGHYERARETSANELKKNLYNVAALRLWSAASFKLNLLPEACRSLYIYDAIYDHRSYFHPVLQINCPDNLRRLQAVSQPLKMYNDLF